MNDCTADAEGRLLAGSWFYDPKAEYPRGHLIAIDTNWRPAVLDDGFHLANGIELSPDGATLYVADSVARIIYAYDYDAVQGRTRRKRVFAKLSSAEGLPDGLAVDQAGYVWTALWYGSCVVRFDPDGTIERRIAVPEKQVSSLAFGGDKLSQLYITTAGHSEPMPVMPPGYDAGVGPFGGPLYRIDLENCGIPQHRARLRAKP